MKNKSDDIYPMIGQFIIITILISSAIFGAWLAGASVSVKTFVIGAAVSAALVLFARIATKGK